MSGSPTRMGTVQMEDAAMKKMLGVIGLMTMMVTSVYAGEGAGSAQQLTFVQFSGASENRGISGRLLDRRYEEYRSGRFAVTTLDTAHLR